MGFGLIGMQISTQRRPRLGVKKWMGGGGVQGVGISFSSPTESTLGLLGESVALSVLL